MKICLVTGASSGLGEALCVELVAEEWTVIGVARSKNKLDDLQQRLGTHQFYPVVCDVSDHDTVLRVSKELQQKGLCPSLFFLNAAVTGEQAVETSDRVDIAKHRQIMAVNYFGVLSWVAAWQQHCLENGGANFMVTSSINAIFAPPKVTAYSASKAAIAKAFEGLSLTYSNTNLVFSVIYPGPIDTKGLKAPCKLPFTASPRSLAKYMIKCAKKK